MLRLREDRTRAAKSVDSLILQKLLVHLSSSKCLPGITLGSTLLPHKSLLSVYQARFLHSECFCTENWNVQVKHKSAFSCAPAGVAFWGMCRRICLSWQEVVKKEERRTGWKNKGGRVEQQHLPDEPGALLERFTVFPGQESFEGLCSHTGCRRHCV